MIFLLNFYIIFQSQPLCSFYYYFFDGFFWVVFDEIFTFLSPYHAVVESSVVNLDFVFKPDHPKALPTAARPHRHRSRSQRAAKLPRRRKRPPPPLRPMQPAVPPARTSTQYSANFRSCSRNRKRKGEAPETASHGEGKGEETLGEDEERAADEGAEIGAGSGSAGESCRPSRSQVRYAMRFFLRFFRSVKNFFWIFEQFCFNCAFIAEILLDFFIDSKDTLIVLDWLIDWLIRLDCVFFVDWLIDWLIDWA